MTTEGRWFSVRVLVESTHSQGEGLDRLFEDKILLVKASTLENARERGEKIAKQSAVEYDNPTGERVAWRFKEILDVKEVLDDKIEDGIEVYYTHVNEREVEQLRRMLQPFRN